MQYTYPFPAPSVTATVILADAPGHDSSILLGTRSRESTAYPGFLCLPGGFLNAAFRDPVTGTIIHAGETVEQTAIREVYEETRISLKAADLQLLCVRSDPETDPRGHVINICFHAIVSRRALDLARPGDDISRLQLLKTRTILTRAQPLAFDHTDIVHLFALKTGA